MKIAKIIKKKVTVLMCLDCGEEAEVKLYRKFGKTHYEWGCPTSSQHELEPCEFIGNVKIINHPYIAKDTWIRVWHKEDSDYRAVRQFIRFDGEKIVTKSACGLCDEDEKKWNLYEFLTSREIDPNVKKNRRGK